VPVLLILLALAAPGSTVQPQTAGSVDSAETSTDPRDSLKEGNRLFRTGRLEEAFDVYRAGWDPEHPDPVLAYNLGTTAHHLGRLAEAVLWYRRAASTSGGGDDLWLTENLDRARDRLGAPRLPPKGLLTRLARHRTPLWILGALAGWTALGLLLTGRSAARLWSDVLAAFAILLLALALLAPRFAAVPAVVLEPCGDGALPAGAEVWARPLADGGASVATPEGPLRCPAGSLEPVEP